MNTRGHFALPAISLPSVAAWSISLALLLALAVFFGLLATTANPVLVGTGAGLLFGMLFFAKPIWNIWLVLVLGLLVVGVLPIWVEAITAKAVWGVSALALVLMMRSWGQALVVPSATRGTPAFVWLALAFIVYALVNTLWQPSTLYAALSGFKRYFQVTGLLFALAWLPINERDIRQWQKFLIIVAVVQLPFALYERFELVPIREGFAYAYPGIVPIDVVAGTFGANMTTGGANAEMATFLIVVLAFLLARQRYGLLGVGRLLLLTPLVLAPLFLGETKVVVVMLPLMFLILYRRELLHRPHYAMAGLVVGVLLTVAAVYAYVEIKKMPLDKLVDETLSYNIYERGHGLYKLNRTRVLTFWADQQGLDDPVGALIGHGLGTAHEVTGGQLARRYPGYGIGLTATSLLLWEQGVLGTVLLFSVLAFAWREADRLRRYPAPQWAKADAAAIQASLPLFAIYFFYRASLLELMSFQIIFWGLLGYLAWLARRYSGYNKTV